MHPLRLDYTNRAVWWTSQGAAWLGIGLIPPTPTYSPPTPTFTSAPALACYQYNTLETCEGNGCKWLDGGCHNP